MAVRITKKGNPESVISRTVLAWADRTAPELKKKFEAATPQGEANPSWERGLPEAGDSWVYTVNESGFTIYNTSGHAKFSEFGTGPIEASPGSFLRFKYYGRWVTAKRVSGQPEQRYIQKVLMAEFPGKTVRESSGGYRV